MSIVQFLLFPCWTPTNVRMFRWTMLKRKKKRLVSEWVGQRIRGTRAAARPIVVRAPDIRRVPQCPADKNNRSITVRARSQLTAHSAVPAVMTSRIRRCRTVREDLHPSHTVAARFIRFLPPSASYFSSFSLRSSVLYYHKFFFFRNVYTKIFFYTPYSYTIILL